VDFNINLKYLFFLDQNSNFKDMKNVTLDQLS